MEIVLYIPTFHTSRLILKPLSVLDAPSYQSHFNDFEVIGHLGRVVPWPYPENGAYQFISNVLLPNMGKDLWCWGIFLKSNPSELIGSIDIRRSSPSGDNRGFWLGKKFWGHKYMQEALVPITDYAFNELLFTEIHSSNALGNIKSRKIKENQGAVLLGVEDFEFVNREYTQIEKMGSS